MSFNFHDEENLDNCNDDERIEEISSKNDLANALEKAGIDHSLSLEELERAMRELKINTPPKPDDLATAWATMGKASMGYDDLVSLLCNFI